MVRRIRDKLQLEFKKMYSNADLAFSAIDFTGKGTITKADFLDSMIVQQKIKFTKAEIEQFFKSVNIFSTEEEGIIFDTFKKLFFPH